ncbi:MAG: methyltransferase [Saprospiraceae bacterium]|nr:methyltransferase [Saprospiraceae bacterium]
MRETMFHFQQFSVCHEHAAMKVGTDGVLLGAWSTPEAKQPRILDIGTGTGLIALMMAQRFPAASIEAIDLDEGAVHDATINFGSSPWGDRLRLHHADARSWASEEATHSFDLLVTNPPFFEGGMLPASTSRQRARHQGSLQLADLCRLSDQLLIPEGKLDMILPWSSLGLLKSVGEKYGLFVSRMIQIRARPQKPVTRMLVSLSRIDVRVEVEDLTIRMAEGNDYSSDYAELTSSFYLPGQINDRVRSEDAGKEKGASVSAYPPSIN